MIHLFVFNFNFNKDIEFSQTILSFFLDSLFSLFSVMSYVYSGTAPERNMLKTPPMGSLIAYIITCEM